MPQALQKKESFAGSHPYACLLAACLTAGTILLLLLKGYWYALMGTPVAILIGLVAYGSLRVTAVIKDEDWMGGEH